MPVLLTAAWGVVLASWAAVTFGDLSATQASWHLLPLSAVLYAACVLSGYALGTRSVAKYLPAAVGACMVAALAWTTMQTTVATNTALARSRVFDDNVRSVQVALERTPPRRAIWNSMSVGEIDRRRSIGPECVRGHCRGPMARNLSPADLVIVPISQPEVRFF